MRGAADVPDMDIAGTGMQAAEALFDAAANNIANADTPGYQSMHPQLSALPGGGVAVTGVTRSPGKGSNPQLSNVDMGEEMASMMQASGAYDANAKVMSEQARMQGALLDIRV